MFYVFNISKMINWADSLYCKHYSFCTDTYKAWDCDARAKGIYITGQTSIRHT